MTDVWLTVVLLGAVTVLLKSVGPVLIGGRELSPRVLGVVSLLAPALLAAFVAVQVFGGARELVVDARAAGLLAAVVALLLRAPILVVVLAAAAATALVRAFA
jgi:branched-subunit amino acid transport protein